MSRVEQALKRTGAWPSDEADVSLPADTRGTQLATPIEEYPIESAAPASTAAPAPRSTEDPWQATAAVPGRRPAGVAPFSGKLVVQRDMSPATAEQYRRLAATLYQAQAEHGINTVMLSSALPREGKTLTTANLALTLSESYRQNVLLIDADLRGASVHTLFGLSISPGLGEFLNRDGAAAPIVPVSKTLSVLPAGTSASNPIAGLVSDRMRQLMQHAKDRFDWVLLDAPPVALLSDASLLGRLTDAIVFVVAAGSTPYRIVQRAIGSLGPERVLGIVLNKASETAMPHDDYYQHYAHEAAARHEE